MKYDFKDIEIPVPSKGAFYLVTGLEDYRDMEFGKHAKQNVASMLDLFNEVGIKQNFQNILDFGCGCGRVLAGWAMLGWAGLYDTNYNLFGVDLHQSLIDWCNENIPNVDARKNELFPPLEFPDNYFDLIYAKSVFTHLTLNTQKKWVVEFRRILKPNAHILISFRGRYFIEKYFASQGGSKIKSVEDIGYDVVREDLNGGSGCTVHHTPEFFSSLFEGFEPILHYDSQKRPCIRLSNYQDIYIFRKL